MESELKKILNTIYQEEKKLTIEEYMNLNRGICINPLRICGIKYIKENINKVTFREEIVNLQKEKLEQQIQKEKLKKIDIKNKEIYEKNIRRIEKEKKEIDFLKMIHNFKIYYEDANYEMSIEEFVYNEILKLLYEKYRSIVEEPDYKINEKNNMLEKTYEFINDDTQYKKYKLLKINKYRKLIKIRFFCLKDVRMKTNNYIMLDNHLSEKICEKLKQLKDKKYIKDLSLKPNYYLGILEKIPSAEDIDFGKTFKFENLKEILPTKLVSYEKGENLWINIERNSITFEEISENFEIIEDDIIKTQVIHCEYFEKAGKFYISHMDHEYIFYSIEEYEKRLCDIKQKGKALKKVKTFKIDNSEIPFILDDGTNILLFFLNEYFNSEKLLLEYFENIN